MQKPIEQLEKFELVKQLIHGSGMNELNPISAAVAGNLFGDIPVGDAIAYASPEGNKPVFIELYQREDMNIYFDETPDWDDMWTVTIDWDSPSLDRILLRFKDFEDRQSFIWSNWYFVS